MSSGELDVIAQKKLVNFVHDLMSQYFDFVCRRVQQEVHSCISYSYQQFLCSAIMPSRARTLCLTAIVPGEPGLAGYPIIRHYACILVDKCEGTGVRELTRG